MSGAKTYALISISQTFHKYFSVFGSYVRICAETYGIVGRILCQHLSQGFVRSWMKGGKSLVLTRAKQKYVRVRACRVEGAALWNVYLHSSIWQSLRVITHSGTKKIVHLLSWGAQRAEARPGSISSPAHRAAERVRKRQRASTTREGPRARDIATGYIIMMGGALEQK